MGRERELRDDAEVAAAPALLVPARVVKAIRSSSVGHCGCVGVVRGRVEGQGWCVRGRPGLLRHSTRVGYRVGDMMCDGGFRQMGCGRSVFLGRLP